MTFQPGQSGNPAGRPKGSVNKQLAMLRDAVEKVLPLVVERALAGDHNAQKLILEKGLPRSKAVELPVEFPLEDGKIPSARIILQQVAAGELALSHAEKILYGLIHAVTQEQKVIEPQPGEFMNAYLGSIIRE